MILPTIFPQLSNNYTPVQILDSETFDVLFSSSNPMRLSVFDEKRITRFQVESGEERSDHVVTSAIEINIEFVLAGFDAREQFKAIRQAFLDHRLVTVQSRMATYEDMLIEAMPHEETSVVYDGAVVPVRLVQWRSVEPEYGELQQEQVANPAQSSTVQRGRQEGQEVPAGGETERQGSTLSRWGLI